MIRSFGVVYFVIFTAVICIVAPTVHGQLAKDPLMEVKELFSRSQEGIITQNTVARLLRENGTAELELTLQSKEIELVDGQLPFMFYSNDMREAGVLPYQMKLMKAAETDGLIQMRQYLLQELEDGVVPAGKRDSIVAKLLLLKTSYDSAKDAVLLPQQLTILKQLKFTRQFKSDFQNAFQQLDTELKLAPEQRERLSEISDELKKTIEALIEENKAKKRKLMLKHLKSVMTILPSEIAKFIEPIVKKLQGEDDLFEDEHQSPLKPAQKAPAK